MLKLQQLKEQKSQQSSHPLRKNSRRSLFVLKEIARNGESLDLPDYCDIEYPNATDDGEITSAKYKNFIVHVKPTDGLYAGGHFRMQVELESVPDYPEKPPKCRMLTKMWHVNIDEKGAICHNFLKVDECANGGYSPVLGLSGIINGLLTLFHGLENPDDPLNIDAAKQYVSNHKEYVNQAKEWTKKYAVTMEIPKGKRAIRLNKQEAIGS